MPKRRKLVTTFKTFRHNFWTETDNHRFYDGVYTPLKAKEIEVSPHERLVYFTVPAARKPYQNGVWMEYSEFPLSIRKYVDQWGKSNGAKKKIIEKKFTKQLQEYFVKKINITPKQAAGIMATEWKMYEEKWPIKKIHAVHKKLGLP